MEPFGAGYMDLTVTSPDQEFHPQKGEESELPEKTVIYKSNPNVRYCGLCDSTTHNDWDVEECPIKG